jgi:SAM-dependent methyltransferase
MTKIGESIPTALAGTDPSENGSGPASVSEVERDETLKWIIPHLASGAESSSLTGLVPTATDSIQIDVAPLRAAETSGVGGATVGATPAEFGSPEALSSAEVLIDGSPPAPADDVVGGLPEAPLFAPPTAEVTDEDLMMVDGAETPAPLRVPAAVVQSAVAPVTPPPPPRIPSSTSPISPSLSPIQANSGEQPSPTASPIPEALSRRTLSKKARPWFEEVFDEDYLRTLPFMTAEQTLREVAFIREALSPPAEAEILDVACGYGRHAIELGQQGLRVTGIDLSLPLLIRAADEAQRRNLPINFIHTDMREMAFDAQFDGAYCVLSSFGYFDEDTNLRVATAMGRALKPGGKLIIDTINRDYIVGDLPTRVWWEGDGCVVLEEVDFNFHNSRILSRRSVVFGDGRQSEQEISIRVYSLHELGRLMQKAGLRVIDVSGSLSTKGQFFGAASRNIVMVCERPNG